MKGKNSFIGLNARQVLGQVGRFGEDIIAAAVHGEVVVDFPESVPFADVVNRRAGLAVQVKMCNGRHAQRPLPKQVVELYKEIETPFLFDKGVYAFVFYSGIDQSGGKNGKSMIWSRKFSRGMRRDIIARELQYIYIVDVGLLRKLVDKPEFIRKGAIVYVPEEKPDRDKVLYLNRTFMAGFPEHRPSHVALLDEAFGRGGWSIRTLEPKLRFVEGVEGHFCRRIPVHVIGSRKTSRAVQRMLERPLPAISLGHASSATDLFPHKPLS